MTDDWGSDRRLVLAELERNERTMIRLADSIESLGKSVVLMSEKIGRLDEVTERVAQLEKQLNNLTTKVAVIGATGCGVGVAAFELLRASFGG